jgi:D-serine deaminase-like pyridoxal phosphate-dependent protein
VNDLQTPALLVDGALFDKNLATMAAALPGPKLRPHVKAHKTSALARRQYEQGHHGFTCATILEVEKMAAAGMGDSLMLANEVVDARRLGAVVEAGSRVILAVDSEATVDAAAAGGVREVIVDVNVGMPRCGIAPDKAGAIADAARARGLEVTGVMGYEGHVVGNDDRAQREKMTAECMELLLAAHRDVGGDIVSGGGTGTYDINTWVNEIQAGSYALMDTAYGKLDLPFDNALSIIATIISVSDGWVVADCGLKAQGMDHGNPTTEGDVWYCADEHLVFSPSTPRKVGDRVRVIPAHVDPTIAYHERMYITDGDDIVDVWEVDMRGW